MFVCVLKSGGIYKPEHVLRLQKQLGYHLYCLSDICFELDNVTVIPLEHNWKGWWSKIEVFKLRGPITYIDLDVDIVGDALKLARPDFTMWEDPLYPQGHNSSVMSWLHTPHNVYHSFMRDSTTPEKKYRRWPKAGDQGFIVDHVRTDIKKFEPGLIRSYKADVKNNGIPDGTIVVAYHGKPKPWDL